MTIQKKSLINSLNTTKKAIVASSTNAKPEVNAPVSARLATRIKSKVATRVHSRLATRVVTRVKSNS